MKCGIESFISEEALRLHNDYLKTLRLRYSVIEKSFPEIKNANFNSILRKRNMCYKDELVALRSEILCHELFFDSFGEPYQSSVAVKNSYRTEASFIYDLYERCREGRGKFMVIYNERNTVNTALLYEPMEIFKIKSPRLCIDLCEHSYFLDYGFDKESYLSNLLTYLKLGALDNFLGNKD